MSSTAEEPKGVIGRVHIDGYPVIYKFINEFPSEDYRSQYPRLAVVSWEYDGEANNGMPNEDLNQQMIQLEDALEAGVEDLGVCTHTYSRTGKNLKELVYQTKSDELFIEALNKALSGYPRFPIQINFYEDKAWEDFKGLLNDFNKDS